MTSFIDTNIVIYLISTAAEDVVKRLIAQRILAGEDLALSAQVLQEFFHQVTRRNARHALPIDVAEDLVLSLQRHKILPITPELVLAAIDLQRRAQLSYWDAAIVAAAAALGCERLLTEDLSHGQVIVGVRIENPFRSAN